MGCFCIEAIQALHEPKDDLATAPEPAPPEDETVAAVGAWLAARWLPAAAWAPEEEWLELEQDLPDPPMPPEALGVLLALVQAYQAGRAMQLDLAVPDEARKLTRIIGTLNRRLPELAPVEQDPRPWNEIAALNDQLDAVRSAVLQGVFPEDGEPEAEPPLAPWRPLIVKVKALAPLVAVGQLLGIDLAEPTAPERLATLVRSLQKVALPPLKDPAAVLRLIARSHAIARIEASFGANPGRVPFARIRAAVERKLQAVKEMLPERIQVADGQLAGMPVRQPNPSQLINAEVLEAAKALQPEVLERLRWQPPPYEELDLLTTGVPAMTLARVVSRPGAPMVRSVPCSRCDAAAVMRELSAAATALPGSGTGAAPAG